MTGPMPERRLLAAILRFALRDLRVGTAMQARNAMIYINGPNLENDCDWLGLDPAAVRAYAQEEQMNQRKFTPEQVAALHQRYIDDGISVEALAAEVGCAPATLSRAFTHAGLPKRKRGPARGLVAKPASEIDELNRLLAGLIPPDGIRAIRVTFEFDMAAGQEPS